MFLRVASISQTFRIPVSESESCPAPQADAVSATALTEPADLAELNLCILPQRWLYSRAGCNKSYVKLQYLENSLGQKGHMNVSVINASVPGGLTVPQ